MLWAFLLLLAATDGDLRIPVVEMHLQNETELALEATRRSLEAAPEEAQLQGLGYLQGRLLQDRGRPDEATDAWGAALGALDDDHPLRPWVLYRVARASEESGHPATAAGLVAPLLDPETDDRLRYQATLLLADTLTTHADCRTVEPLSLTGLSVRERRLVTVARADCMARASRFQAAVASLERLLQETVADEAARRSAERLERVIDRVTRSARPAADPLVQAVGPLQDEAGRELVRLTGLTFHQHREYGRSIPLLERWLEPLDRPGTVRSDQEFEVRYALARGWFWREQFRLAADRFGDLALRCRTLEERSQVLYQQGRSLELGGDRAEALAVFRRAAGTAPDGPFAGPALLSALRIAWVDGRETDGLAFYRRLAADPASARYASRAALFLASSDLARDRRDRAGAWLSDALDYDRDAALEVSYWRGRLAELELRAGDAGAVDRAIDAYREVLEEDYYHPLAQASRSRLRRQLAGRTRFQARRLLASRTASNLYAAWLLAGDRDPAGATARRLLESSYRANDGLRPFFELAPVPVAEWPLWRDDLEGGAEHLLALGLFDAGAEAVSRHFPDSRPPLAYTAGVHLADTAQARRAVLIGDGLARRIARQVEPPLLPVEIRRLQYPLPWSASIHQESRRRSIRPMLLAAIIREESRFEPEALSVASARGLTQFVWHTARRVAAEIGIGPIEPEDLYRPDVSIPLGAAYLSELVDRSRGSVHRAVASYNAGPPQAQLWESYCFSREMEEYYTKTGFSQIRAYLRKVFSSWAQYEELYPMPDPAAGAPPSP